jgi:serine/threonine-protein kinase
VDVSLGGTVGSYRLEALLGRGGMGVVYVAQHLRLRTRQAALKVLAPELTADEEFRQRFIAESETAASLEHPNIIPVYDAGESEGVLYIAMRLVRGTDLARVLHREGRMPPERALRVLWPVAAALDYAHGRGLVHRDVKPGNILIERSEEPDEREHVFLSDFGLGKAVDAASRLTRAGHFVGTLNYASPEQFRGEPPHPATDIYALGCVLVECLTGQVPYPRDSEPAIMYAHLSEPPPRLGERVPGVPPQFEEVVARALSKSPNDRFDSCRDMMQAAHAALSGARTVTGPPAAPATPVPGIPSMPGRSPVGAGGPPGAAGRTHEPPFAPAAPPPVTTPTQPPGRRRGMAPWILAGSLAALVAIVAVVLVAQTGTNTPGTASPTGVPTGGPTESTPTPTPTGPVAASCGPVQDVQRFPGAARSDTVHVENPPALSEYPSQPPTSGPHSDFTVDEGFYPEPVDILEAIHTLEHAAVIIWFSPSLPQNQVQQLQDRFVGRDHVVVAVYDYDEPGGQLPPVTPVALTAWHKLQSCSGVDAPSIEEFLTDFVFDPDAVARYQGEAPELGAGI